MNPIKLSNACQMIRMRRLADKGYAVLGLTAENYLCLSCAPHANSRVFLLRFSASLDLVCTKCAATINPGVVHELEIEIEDLADHRHRAD